MWDFWRDLPNVSGILLTLIGTAMIFMTETSKWLEAKKGMRMTIAIVFVVLGIAGIIAGRIDRKRTEKEQGLAEERQRERETVLNRKLDLANGQLQTTLITQADMNGQLKAMQLVMSDFGKAGFPGTKDLSKALSDLAQTNALNIQVSQELIAQLRKPPLPKKELGDLKTRALRLSQEILQFMADYDKNFPPPPSDHTLSGRVERDYWQRQMGLYSQRFTPRVSGLYSELALNGYRDKDLDDNYPKTLTPITLGTGPSVTSVRIVAERFAALAEQIK